MRTSDFHRFPVDSQTFPGSNRPSQFFRGSHLNMDLDQKGVKTLGRGQEGERIRGLLGQPTVQPHGFLVRFMSFSGRFQAVFNGFHMFSPRFELIFEPPTAWSRRRKPSVALPRLETPWKARLGARAGEELSVDCFGEDLQALLVHPGAQKGISTWISSSEPCKKPLKRPKAALFLSKWHALGLEEPWEGMARQGRLRHSTSKGQHRQAAVLPRLRRCL